MSSSSSEPATPADPGLGPATEPTLRAMVTTLCYDVGLPLIAYARCGVAACHHLDVLASQVGGEAHLTLISPVRVGEVEAPVAPVLREMSWS